MKQKTQFWSFSGIVFYCLSPISLTHAQTPVDPLVQNAASGAIRFQNAASGAIRFQNAASGAIRFQNAASEAIGLRRITLYPYLISDSSSPWTYFKSTAILIDSCSGSSFFIITGRGGLPENPKNYLSTDAVWEDWRIEHNSMPLRTQQATRIQSSVTTNNRQPTMENGQKAIVEAAGWVINAKGNVVLTAAASTLTPHNPWLPKIGCYTSNLR